MTAAIAMTPSPSGWTSDAGAGHIPRDVYRTWTASRPPRPPSSTPWSEAGCTTPGC
ncbi:hypothetical protein ACRAWD_16410 [Caulobacter segnis]